ncbi:hypothetical protein HYPSUDRAFT_149496, partial [Hypholoma sublateritium FD-334 SS-4]
LYTPSPVAMVNPGGFSGLRKAFLDAEQETYNAAVEDNRAADTLADIQRRYFKRFPLSLPFSEEPTEEFLNSVDDAAPDPELKPPSKDMSPEAFARAQRVYEFEVKELKMRKAQIKRRLQYVHNKTKNQQAAYSMGSVDDPMAVLMSKLTGISLHRPRLKTAYNLWGPENRAEAALRSAIYKECFDALPEEQKKAWALRAEAEHNESLRKVEDALKAGPSTSPVDRQKVINCLPKFIEPLLDLIADHTGWKLSVIAGGPEPADGGRLNVISIHSGVTSGSVKMNYGRSERIAYKEHVMTSFGRFLTKCYPVQECRERALQTGHDIMGLAELATQHGIEVHSVPNGEDDELQSRSRGPTPLNSRPATPVPDTPAGVAGPPQPPPTMVTSSPVNAPSPSSATAAPQISTAPVINKPSPQPLPGSITVPDLQNLPVQKGKGKKRKSTAAPASASKKRKTTSGGSSSTAAASSTPTRPIWVSNPLELFRSKQLGGEWDLLVSNWFNLEESSEFTGNAKLGTRSRPRIIGEWIQRARTPNFDPYFDVLRRDGDFEPLRLLGPNGLVNFIGALFFWGCAVQGKSAEIKSDWMDTLKEVAYAIRQLL